MVDELGGGDWSQGGHALTDNRIIVARCNVWDLDFHSAVQDIESGGQWIIW